MKCSNVSKLSLAIALWFGLVTQATSAVWSITYPRPIDEDDLRHDYPLALLELALDKTGVRYSLMPSERIMLQGKSIRLLKENREINVVWSMTDIPREKELLPIRIPIYKGLIGWRVFAINKESTEKFSAVNSMGSLLKLTPLQGEEWPDTKILQANGFNVLIVPDFNQGYHQLALGQGDFFPRSVVEIEDELNNPKIDSNIVLEPNIAVHYTSAMYFFVNRSNPTMARLIETGLERAIEDGSFEALFRTKHKAMLDQINLQNRKVYQLENPQLPEATPIDDPRLWFDPQAESKSHP